MWQYGSKMFPTQPHWLSFSIINVNRAIHSILCEGIHETQTNKQTNMKFKFFFKIKSITLCSPVTANVALLDQNCSNMT